MKITIEASAKEIAEFLYAGARPADSHVVVDRDKFVHDLQKAFAGDLFKR